MTFIGTVRCRAFSATRWTALTVRTAGKKVLDFRDALGGRQEAAGVDAVTFWAGLGLCGYLDFYRVGSAGCAEGGGCRLRGQPGGMVRTPSAAT